MIRTLEGDLCLQECVYYMLYTHSKAKHSLRSVGTPKTSYILSRKIHGRDISLRDFGGKKRVCAINHCVYLIVYNTCNGYYENPFSPYKSSVSFSPARRALCARVRIRGKKDREHGSQSHYKKPSSLSAMRSPRLVAVALRARGGKKKEKEGGFIQIPRH